MSARDRLLRFVKGNEPDHGKAMFIDPETGFALSGAEAVQHVSGLLDAYAHELAEKQRAAVAADDDPSLRADGYGDNRNVLQAADLIDPEKQDSGSIQ